MKRIVLGTLLLVLALTATGCSMISTLTGGGSSSSSKPVSELWNDVPKMDGLTASQIDMPLPIKLIMNTVLGNLGRLNQSGEDQTTGNVDWIAFTTTKTADDVKNFYTPERMAANGWEPSDQSTCVSGSESGAPGVGALCVFQKQQGNQQTELAIIAVQDDQTKQTNLFILRLEAAATPVPTPSN